VRLLRFLLILAFSSLLAAFDFLSPAGAQRPATVPEAGAANPEMARLARALAGDWDTTEHMERSEFFPNGGERRGRAHVHLAAGGTTLVNEVHSDGSAGKLDGLVVIWWDPGAKTYRLFTCFNDPVVRAKFAVMPIGKATNSSTSTRSQSAVKRQSGETRGFILLPRATR
jgi:hypothetical protein